MWWTLDMCTMHIRFIIHLHKYLIQILKQTQLLTHRCYFVWSAITVAKHRLACVHCTCKLYDHVFDARNVDVSVKKLKPKRFDFERRYSFSRRRCDSVDKRVKLVVFWERHWDICVLCCDQYTGQRDILRVMYQVHSRVEAIVADELRYLFSICTVSVLAIAATKQQLRISVNILIRHA